MSQTGQTGQETDRQTDKPVDELARVLLSFTSPSNCDSTDYWQCCDLETKVS